MTVTGKRNATIKKSELANSKSAAVGFSKIVFFHKATAGDTTINLGGLVMPSEVSSAGYTNPSPSELASLNLSLIRKNLKLVSSRGIELIPGLSYTASGLTITLSDSYGPALANEIFTGVIDPVSKSGANFVDADPLVVTGTIPAGSQDFNVGQPFEVNKYPNAQVGAVLVFFDGWLQSRNVGNATASPSADGNYQELPATGGTLSTVIRKNEIDPDNVTNVTVISNGLISERPSESVKADFERLQGQVSSLIATLAAIAGVPTSNFQAAPSSVDLKQFGDRVLAMEQNRARIDAANNWTAAQNIPNLTSDSGSFSMTFTQAGGYSQTITARYKLVNRTVTLMFPDFAATSTAAAAISAGTGALPAAIRPSAAAIWMMVPVRSSTVQNSPGILEINPDGTLRFWKNIDQTVFPTGTANSGIGAGGVTVTLNYHLD